MISSKTGLLFGHLRSLDFHIVSHIIDPYTISPLTANQPITRQTAILISDITKWSEEEVWVLTRCKYHVQSLNERFPHAD